MFQEFHLSQTYHEGLLKLQAKDYEIARELLESVLKDPIISSSQVSNNASDGHLLQLRFLTLKNLATVFLEQGPAHYENALKCYIQAVEIDSNDSVVWNQLGTLSCTMGLFSTSRWAFEQGLLCSPNNWNCMEKLLEILIAIGDEVACISVADLILRHWPSHSRALHVKKTIENAEPIPFAPRGIDKLQAKHIRLKFPDKRKSQESDSSEQTSAKSHHNSFELNLTVATWSALTDAIMSIFELVDDNPTVRNYKHIDISICTSSTSEIVMDSLDGNIVNDSMHSNSNHCQTTPTREKESFGDKEHTQERRSSRLERLKSRKSGKEELEFGNGKGSGKAVFQFLEPFVLNRSGLKDNDSPESNTDTCGRSSDIPKYPTSLEYKDVVQFISKSSKNFGAYHLVHLFLEEISCITIPFQDNFTKILELEKLTRHCGLDRTQACSLFLAELYYDQGLFPDNESKKTEFFSEASYHLCKVIEVVALNNANVHDNTEQTFSIDGKDPILTDNPEFWIRFFWLSGHLSNCSDSKERSFKEFCVCLSLLEDRITEKETPNSIFRPHCKFVRSLTSGIIRREINSMILDSLLETTIKEMMKEKMYVKCIDLLHPLLLHSPDVCSERVSNTPKESERKISLELSALDVLMTACENAEPPNTEFYLKSHLRKLQILACLAGMTESAMPEEDRSFLDRVETSDTKWTPMVVEEVKNIPRVASQIKIAVDQNVNHSDSSSLNAVIGEFQSLLLTIMCHSVRKILHFRNTNSGTLSHANHFDSWCLVDAAISFCKLQHLDTSVSIKLQVDLIVAVHDLLAEYGLCCAGRDSKGEEGAFLKLAIKHLLALDAKLKSLTGDGNEENPSVQKEDMVSDKDHDKENETTEECENSLDAKHDPTVEPTIKCITPHIIKIVGDEDIEEMELHIDSALGQSFFCLYGLTINPDSTNEDDLATHKNTSRGDYQTKEQCADVFQYILPYARALSRGGLIKLRRVLRAIRKHFPQPPDEVLAGNAIEKILDNPDLCEDKLSEVPKFYGNWQNMLDIFFPNAIETGKYDALSAVGSKPYYEVYGNLYYLLAQAEETSATDKYAGFVLRKEGEEFVEQSANLFKYDLLYNPLRFESWLKLANLYDEEVDLLLNDGSKHISVLEWRKNPTFAQRVENGRRRSRRCFLVSLALARTPIQQSQIHELLALVYYDSLQNVVPLYDQRFTVPTKDTKWVEYCENAMKYFKKAFALKPEWLHAFYLGKLCEKLGFSPDEAFSYYSIAASMNPSAVDPTYRMHASRFKLLNTRGKHNLNVVKIAAAYTFDEASKDAFLVKLGLTNQDLVNLNVNDDCNGVLDVDAKLIEEALHILYDDCISALEVCTEGELKHYHKARYALAQGLFNRGEPGDLEKARDELSFCFKSHRSSFTINMWEIDGPKRARKKNPGHSGNRRNLEVSLSESSRKFITCIRKYILLYLNILEKTGDLWMLEKAYIYLRTDKRFSLCLGDIVLVGLGKYMHVLISSIRNTENRGTTDMISLEQMLEKMFNIFMDHPNLWADISSLLEVNNPDMSESDLYGYVHQYIHILETDARLEALEAINEKIRKRFRNPKLANSNFTKICKHASLAWCRCILVKLVSITPLPESDLPCEQANTCLETGVQLFVDLQPDEFLNSSNEDPYSKGLDLNLYQTLSRVKHLRIQKAKEENLELAAMLMRCTYNYCKDSFSVAAPTGISLYTIFFPSHMPIEGPQHLDQDRVEYIDLNIPRKLLLWVYTLLHGRYSNISSVIKYCEEHAKSRMRKGTTTPLPVQQANVQGLVPHSGGAKEKNDRDEQMEVDENPSTSLVSVRSEQQQQEDTVPDSV